MPITTDENTSAVKPGAMEEVTKRIKSAGMDPDLQDKGEAPKGTSERAAAETLNPTEQKTPALIEPPAPGKKSPAEMAQNPKELLSPEPTESAQDDPGEAQDGDVNQKVVEDMGASQSLTDALKETFAGFLEGKGKPGETKKMQPIDSESRLESKEK